ncbi:sensor domain-containing diguanylate cyclase [Candidatus Nitrospira neomarina]|uniref:diguanylate cyclase n=1 Tax=Candidatus Nitrospira neomarina TaxID=3020899 RepID=A0AA96GNM5_9BACT|nr:GGDEF domain-containing protein [Candidatus Nitrospira neomarina]WNM60851.1 GGDEF domain-containing protein [Candidatus Nitrospira neomarina]
MTPELEKKLQSCPSLPSPTNVAIQIINLANEPEIDLYSFIRILNCDPALASKILRIANSPLYPYCKKVESLQQAVLVLGLNATISLALSFSLMKSLQTSRGTGLDYGLYWKRALLAGTASRVLGTACGLAEIEELYLSSLMQDLGMLALDQVFPDLYNPPELDQTSHARIISHESQILGVNHAAVGSWLLTQWNFPDRLRLAVAGSDDPSRIPQGDERAKFVYCVSLSGKIAEIFLRDSHGTYLQAVREDAHTSLNLSSAGLMEVLEATQGLLPETEKIFRTDLETWTEPQVILEKAREALVLRSLQTLKEVQELQQNNAAMEAKFHNLEEIHRHDPLTGALARASLDKYLEASFKQALANKECLTLVFGDLDKFKSVNDTYGHQAGDMVLQSTAHLLRSNLRTTDSVGRYGGEEFVLILPKASSTTAIMVCERILSAFRNTTHEIAEDKRINVTISLGIATHTPDQPYPTITDLLHDADEAVYYSKIHGGNRHTSYDKIQTEQSV